MADFKGNGVQFLQGTYDSLSKLTASQVGAFYITNDTHEMFLGVAANKAPVPLNRWVDVKDSWTDILALTDYKAHPGKIYYAKDKNILCTWNGDSWVQINPDTDTDTILSNVTISDGVSSVGEDGSKKVEYTLTFTQKDIDGTELENPLTAVLTITDELVTSLIVDIQVGVTAEVTETNKAVIKTVGAGSKNDHVVTIEGSTGVTIKDKTDEEGAFIVEGTTYSLSSEGAVLTLKDSNSNQEDIIFAGDNTWIEATGEEANKIVFKHKVADTNTKTDLTITEAETPTAIDVDERKFKAITSFKVDENGHAISAEETEFIIPNTVYTLGDETVPIVAGNGDTEDYTLQIKLIDGNKTLVEPPIDIVTAHLVTVDGTEKIVRNGGNIGSFYSSETIDSKLKAVDAMSYKGVVDNDTIFLPTVDEMVQIGDTYKANANFTLVQNGVTINVSVGDILIANGTEGTPDANGNAYITGEVIWDHIQSGADADTQYKLIGKENTLVLKNTVTNDENNLITLESNEYITSSIDNDKISIIHNEVTVNNTNGDDVTLGYNGNFTVVTGVDRDGAGHVKGIETTKITLPKDDEIYVDVVNPSFVLRTGDALNKGELLFSDGEVISVENTRHDGQTLEVKFNHNKLENKAEDTTPEAAESIPLDGAGTFTILSEVIVDEYGHTKGYSTKRITINKETTYDIEGPQKADGSNVVAWQLKDDDDNLSSGTITLTSETLTYKVENGNASVDLLWGEF